jgi:hypothetical protein
MNINEIEEYLYKFDSNDNQIYSFLNFIYTNVKNDTELSIDFFNAFKKAYKKESINAILNRNPKKDEAIKNKEIQDIINLNYNKKFKKQIYKVIKSGTININYHHNEYLEKLIAKGQPIKYIIIGEAPPFSFIKSFIKSQNDSEFELIFENNYILSKPKAGHYQSSIKKAFEIKQKEESTTPNVFITGLVKEKILFFDIIPVTLPFSTDIRTGWIKHKINGKPLLVSLLDLAIKKNVADKKIIIDPNVKVAFVTPPKTSVSIFDYYSDKKLKITDEISVDITIINDNTTKKKYNVGQDIILPMYKANAMMGANAPSTELLKLALDK